MQDETRIMKSGRVNCWAMQCVKYFAGSGSYMDQCMMWQHREEFKSGRGLESPKYISSSELSDSLPESGEEAG